VVLVTSGRQTTTPPLLSRSVQEAASASPSESISRLAQLKNAAPWTTSEIFRGWEQDQQIAGLLEIADLLPANLTCRYTYCSPT